MVTIGSENKLVKNVSTRVESLEYIFKGFTV